MFRANYATETRLADNSIYLLCVSFVQRMELLFQGSLQLFWLAGACLDVLCHSSTVCWSPVSMESRWTRLLVQFSQALQVLLCFKVMHFVGTAYSNAHWYILQQYFLVLCTTEWRVGSANVVFLWFTFLRVVNCYFFWQNHRSLHEDSRQDNLQRHHSLQCGIPYRFYWILWSYVYGAESHWQTRSVHVRCFSIVKVLSRVFEG